MLQGWLSTIKAVGFDFDQTLVDERYSLTRRWRKTLAEYSHLSAKLGETFFTIYQRQDENYKFHPNDSVLNTTLETLELNQELNTEIFEKFLSSRAEGEQLFAGAKDLLRFLRDKNLVIGIITNGVREYQEPRLKQAGIYDFFNFIFYGDENKKPDTTVFRRCLNVLQLKSPEQFLYVGDNFIEDITSPISIGAKACWISLSETQPSPHDNLIKLPSLQALLESFKKKYASHRS